MCSSAKRYCRSVSDATQSEGTATLKSRIYASLAVYRTQMSAANPTITRRLDVQTLQEYFQRRGEEARVHRLQDKEVLFGGPEKFDNLTAAVSFLQTILNLLTKVRAPLAEIVVCVNDRNSRSRGAFLERCNAFGSGESITQDASAPGKSKSLITSMSTSASRFRSNVLSFSFRLIPQSIRLPPHENKAPDMRKNSPCRRYGSRIRFGHRRDVLRSLFFIISRTRFSFAPASTFTATRYSPLLTGSS